MAKLHDKVENALNEGRILILGGQVIAGVEFRIFFETDFQNVPLTYQRWLFVGLAALLLGLAAVMAPASYHTIAEDHRDTPELLRFATRMLDVGLLPFAVSLGTTMLVCVWKITGLRTAEAVAGVSCAMCILLWYVFPFVVRGQDRKEQKEDAMEEQALKDKVKEVLVESRMVLPGAQALLGFQFINIWMSGFESMPSSWKLTHLVSLCAVALCTALLILPAAYHRIAIKGADSEQFVRFAGRVLLLAMFCLAVGITLDFYVIARKVAFSEAASLGMSGGLLTVFLGLWFGYTSWVRMRRPK